MQVAVELPTNFISMQTETHIKQEISLSYALRLYRKSQVTLSKAAELASLDIYDFIKCCQEDKIPVIEMTKEELLAELNDMNI